MIDQKLGKLEAVHGISPAILQRALIVIILAFIFFFVMLIAFSMRQQFVFFWLATAFLIIKLFTLFSFMSQRKKFVMIYENGFVMGKKICFYKDVADVQLKQTSQILGGTKNEFTITKKSGEKIVLPEAIQNIHSILERIDKSICS